MDSPKYIYTDEVLEMKCIADIFNDRTLSRPKVVKTTVLSKLGDGQNQRLIDSGKSTSTRTGIYLCTNKINILKLKIGF